jgi:hypothetical protein
VTVGNHGKRNPKRDTPWNKLAAELAAHGVDSQYLARVQARVTPEEQLDNLQREIAEEMAGALGRAGEKVDLAWAELELCQARYDAAVREGAAVADRQRLAEAFNEQRVVAERRKRDLQIHREAMGFRRNQILNELYPLPRRLAIPET